MTRVVIIADDLTGALDSACAFAARGLSTRVALDRDELDVALTRPDREVIAYPTGTREGTAAEAEAHIRTILPLLRDFDGILFKKIDSRLKGHVAVELRLLREIFARPVLAAPAVPALGRFVSAGAVTGAGVAEPIPVHPALGCSATIPDTLSDEHLDAALPTRLQDVLYVGAAGLGAALARRLAPEARPVSWQPVAPLLCAIGSRDPVTLAQIEAAPLRPFPAPNGKVPQIAPDALAMIQLLPGEGAIPGPEAARRFATGVAREMRGGHWATLVACGGETAHAILREMGVRALDLLGEVLPGVPAACCCGIDLTLLTKSGGFGPPRLLADLLNKLPSATESG